MMLIFRRDAGGRVRISTTRPIAYVHNGIPYSAQGDVCVGSAFPAYFFRGLPFSSTGRICTNNGGSPTHYQNGTPLTTIFGGGLVVEYNDLLVLSTFDGAPMGNRLTCQNDVA